jgi:hypothetical protein
MVSSTCPYCGESVELTVDPFGATTESYIEDCPVCCRPWNVQVQREDGELSVQLSRDDE